MMINHLTFIKRLIIFGCILLVAGFFILFIDLKCFYSVDFPGWPSTIPRNLSFYISPNENTTVLNPNKINNCESSPYLYIIICSSVNNQEQRNAIRNTWASNQHLKSLNYSVKINFLLGQSHINHHNNLVAIEADKYGDIIQEKFHDTYNNLTIKVGMMFKWVNRNCKGIKYLMKTDDDIFVNINNLLTALSLQSKRSEVLIGHLISNQIPIRDACNIWYTPKYMYSDDKFPNFVSGTGYVMSFDVAVKLYNAAVTTSFIILEDTYFTGICADKAGVKPSNYSGFSYVPRRGDINVSNNSITAHQVNVDMMYAMWNMSQYGHTNYKKSSESFFKRYLRIG